MSLTLDTLSPLRESRRFLSEAVLAWRAAPRTRTWPGVGMVLALGMPLGLIAVRALELGAWPGLAFALDDSGRMGWTYAWVLFGPLAALALLGRLLGGWFDRAQQLSFTDPLTGVFNRRYFSARLEAELGRGRRDGQPTTILCVDVDHLKAINDGHGHRAGDLALRTVASTIAASLRPADVVARVGGDEFAVLLPETALKEATALSKRLVEAVARHGDSTLTRVGISVGVSQARAEDSQSALLACADAAMYRAKQAGGSQVAVAPQVLPTVASAAGVAGPARPARCTSSLGEG